MLLLEDGKGQKWLVTGTADRGFFEKRTAHIELVPLDDFGKPTLSQAMALELDPKKGYRPAGLSALETKTVGEFHLFALSTRGRSGTRLDAFLLDLNAGRIEHLPEFSERIFVDGKRTNPGNALNVLPDGRTIVSVPEKLGSSHEIWAVKQSNEWQYAEISGAFSNGVRPLGEGFLLADYRKGLLHYATLSEEGLQISDKVSSISLPDHPDNISVRNDGGLTVAAQQSFLRAALHVVLSKRFEVPFAAYRVELNEDELSFSRLEIPIPQGAAAVSTVIETEGWFYYSQIRRPFVYACPKKTDGD